MNFNLSLRSKVLGSLLAVLAFFILASWFALYKIQQPSFEALETKVITNQIVRVNHLIENERESLNAFLLDWAAWDDTYEYVADKNYAYYIDNLEGGYLGSFGMSFAAFVDTEGQLVWGEVYPGLSSRTRPIETVFPDGWNLQNPLLQVSGYRSFKTGQVNTTMGPAIISSSAILRSDGRGPHRGHMIVGVFLNNPKLNQIARQLDTHIEIIPYQENSPDDLQPVVDILIKQKKPVTVSTTSDQVTALSLLSDLNDQPIGFLKVTQPRDIMLLGDNSIQSSILLLLAATLLVLVSLWLLINRLVLNPLEKLTGIVEDSGEQVSQDYSGPVLKRMTESLNQWLQNIPKRSRHDEIGLLLHAFTLLGASLQNASSRIWTIGHLDNLTGLPNRRLYFEKLNQQIEHAKIANTEIAVLFLDLDDFKAINDNLSHQAGDQVLTEVALRLKELFGQQKRKYFEGDDSEQDLVARLGGDEFVFMLIGDDLENRMALVAQDIIKLVRKPFSIEDQQFMLGASIGCSTFPADGVDADQLLQCADIAMYAAKNQGKNAWRRYESDNPSDYQTPKLKLVRSNER